ncbi:MAG: replicative DNA helicase [Gammaproteobacteria bacterium]|nr:replicative DNA helicase [Gammaproteobacteria bacterium]NIR86016.1 replicative DNA helicase [Gammaproteobacteria bacterium]NIU07257.1 replicative DNA helicase [Gammaproteobacteria bacterium]NIV54062.1 replicative DNA helicase [Gammaproteobacteria bacterium]NIX88530.1 replicative DNA helicase [Gammaproteobacteria bacterium]
MTAERRPKPIKQPQGIVPPHDLDAERYVLSSVLINPALVDTVLALGVTPPTYYSDKHRHIMQAIVELHEASTPVDVGTVATRLKDLDLLRAAGDAVYLADLVDSTPSILDAHVEQYARTVRDKARLREMVGALRQHAAEGFGVIEDTQVWLDDVEAHVADIARRNEGKSGLVPIVDPATRAFDRVAEASRTGKPPGVPYGLSVLDRKTRGMGETDLVVVAGRPGMGKTAFVLGIAQHVASSTREPDSDLTTFGGVAVFSLEMSAEQLALRAVCSRQRLDSQRIGNGNVRAAEWDQIAEGVNDVAKLPIWIDDTPAINMAAIRSRSRKLQNDLERVRQSQPEAPKLQLVIIDYLQLMGASGSGRRQETREQEVSANTRAAKVLAKEIGCPVVLLSQLNRSVEQRSSKDKRPQLSDLRESGAIEQDADQILFLYRDEYYFPDTLDRGVAEVIIAKQRNGPTGKVKVRFAPEHTRFDNLGDEYDEFDDMFDEGLP